jgi:hypothetical protein
MEYKDFYSRLTHELVEDIAIGLWGADAYCEMPHEVIEAGVSEFDRHYRTPHTLEYAKVQAKLTMLQAVNKTT